MNLFNILVDSTVYLIKTMVHKEAPLVSTSTSIAFMSGEVAILASSLLVASFLVSTLQPTSSKTASNGLQRIRKESWARRLASYLLACVVLSAVAILVSLLLLFVTDTALQILTAVLFGVTIISFAWACVSVLLRLRSREMMSRAN